MSTMNTIPKYAKATNVVTENGMTEVIYHGTKVVTFDSTWISLNTGGYRTKTTKDRMNQVSNQFGLGYKVKQVQGEWIVSYGGKDMIMKGKKLDFARYAD